MNKELPQFPLKFLRWYCKEDLQESILGDMEEQFENDLKTHGSSRARRRFTWTSLRFFRKEIIKPDLGGQRLNNYGMFKNYLKVSVRNILRNKTFSFLNVTGLSVGIASCLLILIYVNNELSYDKYHSKFDRTYRVLQYFGSEKFPVEKRFASSEYQVWGCAPVAPALKDYYPQIDHITRSTSDFDYLVEYNGRRFQEKGIAFADSTLYQLFDWKWIAGDPTTALAKPNTIILSKELAEKYFGDENPIGKSLLMDGEDPHMVTAVFEIPANSHFFFKGFVSMSTFVDFRPEIFDSWGYVDFYTYFTINENADINELDDQIPAFLTSAEVEGYTIQFEPLADAYLNSDAGRQPGAIGNKNNIYLFISVALFILVIACINFINLSTARSVERAKEVAIRKTIGSQRRALITQFLVEAIILTFAAFAIAILIVIFCHPYLEILVGKAMPITWLMSPSNFILGLVSGILVGLITGSYPALVLSKFKPVQVLKGSFKSSSEGVWLRKFLVILQFSLSIILIVGTAVVYNQLQFLRQHEKGFDPEQILVIDYGWDWRVQKSLTSIKSEISKHNAVQAIAASRATPGDFFPNAGTSIEDPSGERTFRDPALYEIDEDFIPTYEMEMVAGRNYSKEFPSDSSTSLILNEAGARMFGYENPADIIGKKFSQWGREGHVVGVVKDFNYVSLHQEVEPLALRYATKWNTSMLSLKLNSQDYSQTLDELQDLWEELVPYRPFVAHFNDTNFDQQYETDERFGTVFTVFSSLAIFVACLGLFGLTIYSTNQRAKEIGVRKVLGASTQRIVALLSYDFIKLFIVALTLSIPVSLIVMNKWLDDFAYRIKIGWELFALAAVLTLIISLITMSFRTIKAALSNPAHILKDE